MELVEEVQMGKHGDPSHTLDIPPSFSNELGTQASESLGQVKGPLSAFPYQVQAISRALWFVGRDATWVFSEKVCHVYIVLRGTEIDRVRLQCLLMSMWWACLPTHRYSLSISSSSVLGSHRQYAHPRHTFLLRLMLGDLESVYVKP